MRLEGVVRSFLSYQRWLVSRAQRSMKRSAMVRCRPGTVTVRGGRSNQKSSRS